MKEVNWDKEDSNVLAVYYFGVGEMKTLKYFKGEEGYLMVSSDGIVYRSSYRDLEDLEERVSEGLQVRPVLEMPWTIYNNSKPFSELTDEQKGKLMVASLSYRVMYKHGIEWTELEEEPLWSDESIYRVISLELLTIAAELPEELGIAKKESLAMSLLDLRAAWNF